MTERSLLERGASWLGAHLRHPLNLAAARVARALKGRPVQPQARKRVTFLIDLVQDAEIILPIAHAAKQQFDVAICMTSWLSRVAAHIPARVSAEGFSPQVCARDDLFGPAPDLAACDALFAASDSTAASHRFVHSAITRAKAAGVATFTIQHGLENVALTSKEDGAHTIASDHVFTWGPPAALPDWIAPDLRRRCIGVGRPAASPTARDFAFPDDLQGPVVGVFENLHWERYDEAYRDRFLADLLAAAAARPSISFVVKPHPAGLWLAKNQARLAAAPANLRMADPAAAEWTGLSSTALIGRAAAIVTTPSTVALDAAQLGAPTGVAAYGLELAAYAPLPLIAGLEDWLALVDRAAAAQPDPALEAFRRRHLIDGDGAARVVAAMQDLLQRRRTD